MKICIYGASSVKTSDVYIKAVENLCEHLAKKGHSLVFGGGASGLMGAAARGFKKGGGHVLGISPRFFDVDGVLFDDCDEFIYTETMSERKKLLEDSSDCFIVFPGGVGTFDEFFETLTLKQLGVHNKAIAVYNINSYYDSLSNLLDHACDEMFLSSESMKLFKITDSALELADYLDGYDEGTLSPEQTKFI